MIFCSCINNKKTEDYSNPDRNTKKPLSGKKIYINGCLSGLKAQKIYIFQHPYFKQLLDSANIKNDSFSLIIDSSILLDINDSYGIKVKGEDGKIFRAFFYNHVLSTKAQKFLYDGFIIDTNFITINGNRSFDSGLVIKASVTNDSYLRLQMTQFGYLDNDSIKRTLQVKNYISIINQYPKSMYLLYQLSLNKSVIRKNEFFSFLQLFDKAVIQSELGKKMLTYAARKSDNQQLPDMNLVGKDGKPFNIFDTSAKLNMIVIWASWCGPCRDEIPQLKKLYELYMYRGLSITSISIDEDITAWKRALNSESMPWKQLIVPKEKTELFNTLYEVGSIPYVIFLDNKGKVITRSIGVDANTQEDYKTIIHKYIPK
jgi:thiol-disulfide isomerase/thioredoxin